VVDCSACFFRGLAKFQIWAQTILIPDDNFYPRTSKEEFLIVSVIFKWCYSFKVA
jgi:hypothetical protein